MKSFILIVCSLTVLLSTSNALAQVRVLACEPEWQSLTEAIGGDLVQVDRATTAFQDPHYIEARPSLIAKARRADMIFCTGAELEIGWLPLLQRQGGNPRIQQDQPGYLMAAEQVQLIDVPSPSQLDRIAGDIHASGNPHMFWDPARLTQVAEVLAERLSEIDPANSEQYQQRLTDFKTRWATHSKKLKDMAAPLAGKKVIVHHTSWRYLLNWLGMETVGDIEPKPGLPPTSGHLTQLLQIVRQQKPDFILIANYQNDRGAQWLNDRTDLPVLSLPHTVGGHEQASDLFTLYDYVITQLVDIVQ